MFFSNINKEIQEIRKQTVRIKNLAEKLKDSPNKEIAAQYQKMYDNAVKEMADWWIDDLEEYNYQFEKGFEDLFNDFIAQNKSNKMIISNENISGKALSYKDKIGKKLLMALGKDIVFTDTSIHFLMTLERELILTTPPEIITIDDKWGVSFEKIKTGLCAFEISYQDIDKLTYKPARKNIWLWTKDKDKGYFAYKKNLIRFTSKWENELLPIIDSLKIKITNLFKENEKEKEKIKKEKERLLKLQQEIEKKQQEIEKEKNRKEEKKRLENLEVSQNKILNELDKDGNGEIDVLEGDDFKLLLENYQEKIILIDRDYIKQFVKVSSYLNRKKTNLHDLFKSIKKTPNEKILKKYVKILKDEIYTYNLILFNSLNMIVSLCEDDMITFYKIHESFDNLNMFDSKHEQDISNKLSKINDGLKDVSNNLLNIEDSLGNLMSEVKISGDKIVKSMEELKYVTEKTNKNLSNNLKKINSTLKVGNFINIINAYQNYKIRKKISQ